MRLAIKNQGFTIIEVLAVISILTIGLLGVSSLVVQNIQAQSVNRNYFTASMLAQEGLELVRNSRDTNWLKQDDWLGQTSGIDILGDDLSNDYNYTIDYLGTINVGPDSINQARLYQTGTGFYTHISAGNQATRFYRLITVDNSSGVYLDVEAYVEWEERGRTHTYKAQTVLYDWR